ncbi:hypothetical protein XELAEV_18002758mg, partial [Xenopus laevis]
HLYASVKGEVGYFHWTQALPAWYKSCNGGFYGLAVYISPSYNKFHDYGLQASPIISNESNNYCIQILRKIPVLTKFQIWWHHNIYNSVYQAFLACVVQED